MTLPTALYVVATPIGNLGDMSARGLEVLRSCRRLACEDTRRTRELLTALAIPAPGKELISYYDQVERAKAAGLIEQLRASDEPLALVSDAGTPTLSDPGYHLVREAHRQGVPVVPIPGSCAAIALVSASGLAPQRVIFIGFWGDGRAENERYGGATVVGYVPARDTGRMLAQLARDCPDAELCWGRELTKKFETIRRCAARAAPELWAQDPAKGEVTLAVQFPAADSEAEAAAAEAHVRATAPALLAAGASVRALTDAYSTLPMRRKQLYGLLGELSRDAGER